MQLGHNVGALLSDSRHSLTQVILSSVSDLEKEQLLARWKGRVRQPCSFYGLCLHDVDQRLRKQGKGKIMIEVRFAVGLIGASKSLVGMVAFRVECQCFVVLGSGLCRPASVDFFESFAAPTDSLGYYDAALLFSQTRSQKEVFGKTSTGSSNGSVCAVLLKINPLRETA